MMLISIWFSQQEDLRTGVTLHPSQGTVGGPCWDTGRAEAAPAAARCTFPPSIALHLRALHNTNANPGITLNQRKCNRVSLIEWKVLNKHAPKTLKLKSILQMYIPIPPVSGRTRGIRDTPVPGDAARSSRCTPVPGRRVQRLNFRSRCLTNNTPGTQAWRILLCHAEMWHCHYDSVCFTESCGVQSDLATQGATPEIIHTLKQRVLENTCLVVSRNWANPKV